MKKLLREILPPVVLRMLKKSTFVPCYSSYTEAFAQCGMAYQASHLVKIVVDKNDLFQKKLKSEKTHQFDFSALRTMIGLGLVQRGDTLRVLDFGGGAGFHYFIAEACFGSFLNLQWNVVETTAMVNEAKRLQTENLKFFDRMEDAVSDLGKVDLIFSSCSLCYTPKPLEFLGQLLAIGAPHLFLTRLPLSTMESEKIVVQTSSLSANGPGPLPAGYQDGLVQIPVTFSLKSEVENLLSSQYRIKFVLQEDRGVFQAGSSPIDMYGFYCERL